jgi:hypothetical protein
MKFLDAPENQGIRFAFFHLHPLADESAFISWIKATDSDDSLRRKERVRRFSELAAAFAEIMSDRLGEQTAPYDEENPFHPACVGAYWHGLGDFFISLHTGSIEVEES